MLNLALNGGIFSSIFNAIKNIVTFVLNINDILIGLMKGTIVFAFSLVYYLVMGICSIVNFAEMLFKKFAGIDDILTASGEKMNILDIFIKSDEIWGLWVAILVLSIVLLFLFTIVAVIKSEFALDAKGSAKGPIIARSLKSLAMFIIVPVVSLLGVYAVNAITDTINSMMKGSDNSTMANQIFYVMAYNANKVRDNDSFYNFINGYSNRKGKAANDNGGAFSGSQDNVAYQIDMAFKGSYECKYSYKWISFPIDMLEADDFTTLMLPCIGKRSTYNIWDVTQVCHFYNLMQMDYIIGIGSAIVIAYMLLSMCCVLVKRIFELVILLLLSAPMISLAPLDGGSASKSWQKEFIKRVIAIVAPVFSINMYFIMIPLFQKISIFGGLNAIENALLGTISMSSMGVPAVVAAVVIYDLIFQLIAICVGMSVVKTSQALLCNLLGIEDLVKSGQEATKKAVGTAVSVAAMATGVGGAGMAAIKGAGAAMKGAAAAGKGNRLAGLKSGWQSTAKERGQAMDLLKDKTIGSDMVKNSAFGQLFDKSTYTNMGKTNKQIDAEKRKKEKMKDQEATEAATTQRTQDAEQKTLKKEYQTQTAQHYNTKMADIDKQLVSGPYSQGNIDAAKGEHDAAKKKLDAFKKQEAEMRKNGASEEDIARKITNTKEYKEAHQAEADTRKKHEELVKGRADLQSQHSDLMHARENAYAGIEKQKGEYFRGVDGSVMFKSAEAKAAEESAAEAKKAEELRPDRAKGAVDHNAIERGAEKLGEALEKIARNIAESPVGQGAAAVGKKVGEVVGGAADTVGKVTGSGKAQLEAMEGGQTMPTAGDALLRQTAQLEATSARDTNDQMSEQVEKGLKEASGDLAKAIKDALQSGKLNVEGINQLKASMEAFNKNFLAAQKNDQTAQEMKAAIDELKKTLTDLVKKS